MLRFATISKQSFWLDEALAVRELHLSFGSMLSSIAAKEPNPPLFFIVAWPWAKLFGTSEAGVRSLSAIAGTAVIPISYLCGRELVSKRAGLVAAVLVAVSPFMIWYSQEAREYMLLAALCSASFLFWARAWRRGSARDVAWWAVFSALAMVTHYFAAFLLIPEALALVWRVRGRAVLFALGALVVVGAALLPHFLSHASRPSGWIGVPAVTRLRQLPITFALGYQTSTVGWGLLGAAALAAIVIALVVIAGSDAELRGVGVAAGIALSVLLLPLGLAAVGHDYYVPRALIAAWVPLAVVLGAACTVSRARAFGAGLAVVAVCAFVVAGITIDSDAGYQKPPWRAVAAALGRASGPRAVVAYNGGFAAVPLALYMDGTHSGRGDRAVQGQRDRRRRRFVAGDGGPSA